MKIMYEGGDFQTTEFINVTQDQFNELVDRSAIFYDSDRKMGYWLMSYDTWIILAIGLDQVPGGYDIEVKLENETEIH